MSREEEKYFNSNKDLWNQKTAIHKHSDFYDLEGFKKGRNVLNSIELDELGNVENKSLLHLQCHFGLDTLSWARLGAKVTGVDLSDKAIHTANEIKDELSIDASFVCANVYDLKTTADHIPDKTISFKMYTPGYVGDGSQQI